LFTLSPKYVKSSTFSEDLPAVFMMVILPCIVTHEHTLHFFVGPFTNTLVSPHKKLPVPELVKKFPTFYRTQIVILSSQKPVRGPCSPARWIESVLSHPISLRSILILFSPLCLVLPSNIF
jgi:hypothetical protein